MHFILVEKTHDKLDHEAVTASIICFQRFFMEILWNP